MVGKVTTGKGAAGLIKYCYEVPGEQTTRGELLYSNELFESYLPNGKLDINSLADQFHDTARLNGKTEKFLWHQTFNFPPEEKVSNEMMIKIAKDFAKNFGFENNQYVIFRHSDKAHDHFHFIGNRINANGKNTASMEDNYMRIQKFCRSMEEKYNLKVTLNPKQKIEGKYTPENKRVEHLKKILDELISKCRTMSELSIELKKKGIIMHLSRGVSFTDKKSGVTFKGSYLGKEYNRANIERRLGQTKELGQLETKNQKKDQHLELEKDMSPEERLARAVTGPNSAYETNKDLARIDESLRNAAPKKYRRKIK